MFYLLGIASTLAAFFFLNCFLSAISAAIWLIASSASKNWSAQNRVRLIFSLRLLPAAAAFIFAAAFWLPAYFFFEPNSSDEVVGLKMGVLAFAAALGASLAIFRTLKSYLATRRLLADWLARAEKINVDEIAFPIYRIEHRFPVLAVVGALRPRVFVAKQVFESLNHAEIKAALAHEKGHLASRDNLKRFALDFCRNLLIFPVNRKLDAAWTEAAEAAADEYAARRVGKCGAVDLAATIVKISRLVPIGVKPGLPSGLFLVEQNCGDINTRVRRLIDSPENQISQKPFAFKFNFSFLFFGSLAAACFLTLEVEVYRNIHQVIEVFVRVLQ